MARARSESAQLGDLERLLANDFDYREMGPYHFLVEETADFWPSRGRWIFRDKSRDGFGVSDLIGALKIWREEEEARRKPKLPSVGAWKYAAGYWPRRA